MLGVETKTQQIMEHLNPNSNSDFADILSKSGEILEENAMASDEVLSKEYTALESLPYSTTHPNYYTMPLEHRCKIRYRNILPSYEAGVDPNNHRFGSVDFVDHRPRTTREETEKSRVFISSAPTSFGINSHLDMLEQYKIGLSICLTKLVEKGYNKMEEYWPATASKQSLDFAEEIIWYRSGYQHTIIRYQDWPDFGLPDTSSCQKLLEFVREWMKDNPDKLVLFHCSAGAGRAPTFAAIMFAMDLIDEGKSVNRFELVKNIRMYRAGAIQNFDQYKFFATVIHEYNVKKKIRETLTH